MRAFLANKLQRLPPSWREAAPVLALAVFAGLLGVAFHEVAEHGHRWLFTAAGETKAGAAATGAGDWTDFATFAGWTLLLITGASTGAALLTRRFAPEAAGGGVLAVKLAFRRDFGSIAPRVGAVKFIASALTLAGGVSLGPEGPAVQIGAAAMSGGAGAFGVAKHKRRLFCACGAAAALAAAFNAPLAAIAFVLEEIIGALSSRFTGAILLAAVAGALVVHTVSGPQPAFQINPTELADPSWFGVLLCAPVAAVAALAGAAFQAGALATRARVRALRHRRFPTWFAPVAGALGTWVFGLAAFWWTARCGAPNTGVFGIGYEAVTDAISGRLLWHAALVLGAAKLIASFLAAGSGGNGGIFAPSFCIGGLFAAAAAAFAVHFGAPLTRSDYAMLVMSGMCAGFAAVVRAPVTAILLIFEVTQQFVMVPFLLVAALLGKVLAQVFSKEGMYARMLRQDGEDPWRALPPGDFRKWAEMPVGELANFRPVTLSDLSPAALANALDQHRFSCFPVVGTDGSVRGVLSRTAAQLALATNATPVLEPPVWASPALPLSSAQARFMESPSNFLCIGERTHKHLVGILTLHDLLRGQGTLLEE